MTWPNFWINERIIIIRFRTERRFLTVVGIHAPEGEKLETEVL